MATVGIWKINKRLDRVIEYIKDENKTSVDSNNEISGRTNLVSSINCNVDTCLEEMRIIKKRFNKENGILGFHAYQSFKGNELNPNDAHKIGLELANEMWGDRFQIIVSTHVNTDSIHNHFVINSVSFLDGKRYYDNHNSYAELRKISDNICQEHNLSVLKEKPTRRGLNYLNFQVQNSNKLSYYKLAKYNLDMAISKAHSYYEFIQILNSMNYEVIERSGKLSIRDKNYKRNIRIERYYGESYSIENIKKQIAGLYIPITKRNNHPNKNNLFNNKILTSNKNLLRIYIKYLHLLKMYPQYENKNKLSYEVKQDVLKMDELSKQAELLIKNNIETEDEFITCFDNKYQELESLQKAKKNSTLIDKKDINNKIKGIREEIKLLEQIRIRKQKIYDNIEKIEKEVNDIEYIR